MRVLSRKVNESVVIGDAIEVTVVEIDRGNVTLGITVPWYVPVYRREIYDANQREKKAQGDTDVQSPEA